MHFEGKERQKHPEFKQRLFVNTVQKKWCLCKDTTNSAKNVRAHIILFLLLAVEYRKYKLVTKWLVPATNHRFQLHLLLERPLAGLTSFSLLPISKHSCCHPRHSICTQRWSQQQQTRFHTRIAHYPDERDSATTLVLHSMIPVVVPSQRSEGSAPIVCNMVIWTARSPYLEISFQTLARSSPCL